MSDKTKYTFHLPTKLLERVRRAVYWTPHMTMADLAEVAIAEKLSQMELDRGEPFPERTGPIKLGRPVRPRAAIGGELS